MTAETLYEQQSGTIRRRVERMVGSRETAEDLTQEAFLRFWRSAPSDLTHEQGAAWLHRTASNLALDELRRRRLRDHEALEESAAEAIAADGADALTVQEALARLSPHQRLLVLLRFQAGLSHAEIAAVLDISTEAARKRVTRARRAFAAAYHGTLPPARPLILLEAYDDPAPYVAWLSREGAEVRPFRPGALESQVAMAGGVVLGGSVVDLHPSLYGESPRVHLHTPNLERDARELRVLRAALQASVPLVGVCRGAQLLNIALGGSLYQDIGEDGVADLAHWGTRHRVATVPGTHTRRILGARATVWSEHHQAPRRVGRGLRPTSRSEDSVDESVELAGERLVLGVQWHPEHPESGRDGRRIAEALVDAATKRAA